MRMIYKSLFTEEAMTNQNYSTHVDERKTSGNIYIKKS